MFSVRNDQTFNNVDSAETLSIPIISIGTAAVKPPGSIGYDLLTETLWISDGFQWIQVGGNVIACGGTFTNERGPQGPQGEPGRGAQGARGPQGAPGESIRGPQGEKGDSIVGPKGEKGDSIVGPRGPQGEKGESIVGPQGEKGESIVGPKGDSIVGPRGPQGEKGDSIVGPQGEKGESIVGPRGPQGEKGESVIGPQGEKGESIVGPQGERGSDALEQFSCDYITIQPTNKPEIDLSTSTTILNTYNYQSPPTLLLPTPPTERMHNTICHLQLAHSRTAPVHIKTIRGTFILGEANARSAQLFFSHDHWIELFSNNLSWYADTLQRKIVPDSTSGIKFGSSLSLSADGNTLAIGSPYDSPSGSTSVYTRRSDNVWVCQASRLIGSRGTSDALQGCAVALDAAGTTLVVGGKGCNNNNGGAWVFVRKDDQWVQDGEKLVGVGNIGYAQQGTSVSISADGSTIAVGGPSDNSNTGACWIFTRSNNGWIQHGNKLVGLESKDQAKQGFTVSLSDSGDIVAIGAPGDSGDTGCGYTFSRISGVWVQLGTKITGTSGSGARQGSAIVISGNGKYLGLGGINQNSTSGATWMFRRHDDTWIQLGEALIGDGALDPSMQGCALALSGDGKTLAIGGSNDNSGIGATWVFTLNDDIYVQRAKLSDVSATGSEQGTCLSLSADGTTLAIGAPLASSNVGQVYIYV